MNIKIPKQLIDKNLINELIIEFVGVRNYKIIVGNELISVPDDVFNACSQIIFHIDNKNSQQTTETFEKHQVLFPKDIKKLFSTKYDELIQHNLKKKSQ